MGTFEDQLSKFKSNLRMEIIKYCSTNKHKLKMDRRDEDFQEITDLVISRFNISEKDLFWELDKEKSKSFDIYGEIKIKVVKKTSGFGRERVMDFCMYDVKVSLDNGNEQVKIHDIDWIRLEDR